MTQELLALISKIQTVRSHLSLGQQRNFLLGGQSGSGKTTLLDWCVSHYQATAEPNINRVLIIKIDAPVGDSSPKPIFQRMLLECVASFRRRANEEELLEWLILYLQKCHVEIIIIDEIEHIKRHLIRRRLLEISNLTPGIPIICASCNPIEFTEGDSEIAERWNDFFAIPQYTGERLQQLFAFFELLLPFPAPSRLADYQIKTKEGTVDGPAKLIEVWTGSIMRDIMILIADASQQAIKQDLPNLTPMLLEETWRAIQSKQVTDFRSVVNSSED